MDLSQDWDYITHVADIRRERNQTPWHVDKHYLEVIGAAGELAARRFLGLPEKLHTKFDGGKDLFWRGYSLDVKATKLTPNIEYRYLQWTEGKPIRADIIMMMGVDLGAKGAIPLGWAFAFELINAPINYERDRPCHEISILDLRPDWGLFALPSRSRVERAIAKQLAMP